VSVFYIVALKQSNGIFLLLTFLRVSVFYIVALKQSNGIFLHAKGRISSNKVEIKTTRTPF